MISLIPVTTRQQIEAVAALADAIWREHYVPLVGLPQVEFMLEQFQSADAIAGQIEREQYRYWLLPEEGYLAVAPMPDGTLFLSKIYVRRTARGKGYGRGMIRFAEEYAKANGLKEVWLTVNKHNQGSIEFYEHLGFYKSRAMTTDIGNGFIMDDWRMAKTITP